MKKYTAPKIKDLTAEQLEATYKKVKANCYTDPDTGCHVWNAGCNSAGYPMVNVEGAGRRARYLARRIVYAHVHKGYVPNGKLELKATCGNSRCCNEKHLVSSSRSGILKAAYKRNPPSASYRISHQREGNKRSIVPIELAREIRSRRAAGEKLTAIAKDVGLSMSWCGAISRNEARKEQATHASIFSGGGLL